MALVLFATGWSRAATPELIPAIIGWRSTESRALAESPLRLLDEPGGASVRTEWAPLYRDARGGRYEWAREEYEWRRPARSTMLGVAVLGERVKVSGEERAWQLGSVAGGPPRVALLWGDRFGPVAIASAAGAGPGWIPGVSLAAGVERGPGWKAEITWSRWASRSRYAARYTDSSVLAEARWFDQRVECGLRGPTAAGDIELRMASLDHVPGARESHDAVEPLLGWRSLLVAWAPRGLPGRTQLRLEHGMGRSGFSANRGGVGFASAGGGVRNDMASVHVGPAVGDWAIRGWVGQWRSESGGDLATWPFAALTVLTGTRRYASSAAQLGHLGVSFDQANVNRPWEAGLSTLWVRPRFSYESWQGTLFGLGRDDVSSGSLRIDGALLAGLRLAASRPIGTTLARLEVVQWVPLHVSRVHVPSVGGGGATDSGRSGGSTAWGGALIRGSLSLR